MITRHTYFVTLLLWAYQCTYHVTHCQEQANNQVCLIVPPDVEECYIRFQGKPIENKAAQVNCLQMLLWNYRPESNLTQSELAYFRTLVMDPAVSSAQSGAGGIATGIGLPPSGSRTRKEYRLLSAQERQRFHSALNKLYEDGIISAFARLYAAAVNNHQNGASYLPWNRVFIALFEEALRRQDPTVFLPFWDSTIDNDMDNPVNSVIWTPEYFGGGAGDVIDGPAAGWVTTQGNLERNYGRNSRLLSKDQIRNILTRCNLKDISQPFTSRRYDFEYHFGGPHVWVGGDMESPSASGYDPIFYMHHAFVDYVWELFRRRQFRRCGTDPALDYPELTAGDPHAADAPMVGFDWLTNRDGIKHDWMDNWYDYESTPSCPNCCEGCTFPAPIYCERRRRVCVARSRRTFAFGPTRDSQTRIQDLFAQAHLDPREIETLEYLQPPRNRGHEFQAPPSDGRTIQTAIADAFESIQLQDITSPHRQSKKLRPQPKSAEIHMSSPKLHGGPLLNDPRNDMTGQVPDLQTFTDNIGPPMNDRIGPPLQERMGPPLNDHMGPPLQDRRGQPISDRLGQPIANRRGQHNMQNPRGGMPMQNPLGGSPMQNHRGGQPMQNPMQNPRGGPPMQNPRGGPPMQNPLVGPPMQNGPPMHNGRNGPPMQNPRPGPPMQSGRGPLLSEIRGPSLAERLGQPLPLDGPPPPIDLRGPMPPKFRQQLKLRRTSVLDPRGSMIHGDRMAGRRNGFMGTGTSPRRSFMDVVRT